MGAALQMVSHQSLEVEAAIRLYREYRQKYVAWQDLDRVRILMLMDAAVVEREVEV